MSENINNAGNPAINNNQATLGQPLSPSGQAKPEVNQPSWQQLAEMSELDPKEYDSPEKFAKSYKEARKGLADQGQKIKEYEERFGQVTPIIQAILSDQELYKQVEAKIKGEPGKPNKSDSDQSAQVIEPIARDVNDTKMVLMDQAVRRVESDYGIDKLSETDRDKAVTEVKQALQLIFPKNYVPTIAEFDSGLRMAYDAYFGRKNRPQPTVEVPTTPGFGTPRSAGYTPGKMTADMLTSDQKRAAEKMGMSYEDYIKNM